MRKKYRCRVQVTCHCAAYDFPHRLGGGRCSGAEWAASYFLFERSACCDKCNNNACTHCEVATGQESIEYCEGYMEHLRSQPPERYPRDEEDEFKKLEYSRYADH